jgi:arabinogalactan endo-1,4-beta-galactosidase
MPDEPKKASPIYESSKYLTWEDEIKDLKRELESISKEYKFVRKELELCREQTMKQ